MTLNEIQREEISRKVHALTEMQAKEALIKFVVAQAETSQFVRKWLPGLFNNTEDK